MFAHISKIFTFLFILNQHSTFCTKMQMKSHKKTAPDGVRHKECRHHQVCGLVIAAVCVCV